MRLTGACSTLLAVSWLAAQVVMASADYPEQIGLLPHLERVALKYDCYFTMEEQVGADGLVNPISSLDVTWPNEASTLDQQLEHLSKSLPQISLLRPEATPCVIHVIDKKLRGAPEYALDKTVANFEFSGTPDKLVMRLGDRVPNLQLKRWGFTGEPGIDYISHISIRSLKPLSVRDLLTRFVPIAGYSRILWVSQTWQKAPPQSEVKLIGGFHFYRPGPSAPPRLTLPLPVDELVADASVRARQADIKAIVEHLKVAKEHDRSPSSNMRWALRLLGEMRASEGVPVLLEFLDWQYSPWGILEESYPAVYALSKIGKPAVNEILKQLAKEEDVLRRGLMCEVLRKVEGNKQAIRLVEDVLAETQPAEEKKNVEAALKCLRTDGPIIDPLLPKERYSAPKQDK